MKERHDFFRLYRSLALLVVLEVVGLCLVRQQRSDLTWSQAWIGQVYTWLSDVRHFPALKAENQALWAENARLKQLALPVSPEGCLPASDPENWTARVVHNTIVRSKNYLTLDKGAADGVVPGMGVVGDQGVVGRIKAVSAHFSTAVSLLHTDVFVSAEVTPLGVLGTVTWGGQDPTRAQLRYVPRHVSVQVGMRVVSSGYNAVFPPGIDIGYVQDVYLADEAIFYDITLRLSTDFSRLHYVRLVWSDPTERNQLIENVEAFYR